MPVSILITWRINNGFTIKLDRNLYAREAVIKALYRFHEKYIISYETDGAFIHVLLPGAISINPLNWKLDDTYAPASENLGSLVENEIADIGADAQVVLSRGTIVTNGKADPMPDELAKIAAKYFGPDGRHDNDYTLFYNNIKANVAKRIAAYKSGK